MAGVEQGGEAGRASGDTYRRLADRIAGIEAATSKSELGFIDMTELLGVEAHQQQRSFADLMGFISMIESKRPLEMQKKADEAAAQAARPQMVSQAAAPAGQGAAIKLPEYPGLEEAMRKQPRPEEAAEPGKPEKPKMGVRRIDTSGLVLPALDPKDQITELERIIEGLRQDIFDREHIGIVIMEVYGLKQVVDDERRDKKRSAKSTTQRSVSNVRDRRIAEAIVLLRRRK